MKLKIKILLVLLLAVASLQANAQLASGDIALVGVNSDVVPDEFAIVTLADIPSGQTIYISDYGWDGSTFATTTNGTEGAITWTTTTTIPAGTLLNFTIQSPAGIPIIGGDLSTYGTVSATGWTLSSSAVASGGDNWFIYQGASATSVPSTWVYGFANFSTDVGGTVPPGEWLPSGSPTATTSQLPTALTLGTTAVGLTTTSYHADNMVYTGTLFGDKSSLLTSIGTRSNWNGDEFTTQDISPGGTNFPGSNPVFTVVTPNTPPTASSFTAAGGPYESLTYIFSTSDFGYSDGDGDPMSHLLIEVAPTAGTLYIDIDGDDLYDAGEELMASDQVSKANLDAGHLQYIQNGSTNTTFQFEVNDGTENSTGNYIATLNVSPVPTVTLEVSPTSRPESQLTATTITATLSNAYGVNTTVNLAFSGTTTNTVDYNRSGTSIVISAGATTGTVTLTNINDSFYEGDETVITDISSVVNGTESGTQQVTYTITEDDPQPTATLLLRPVYNPIADESGGQAYIVGQLSATAGVTVSIPLSFSGTATGSGTDYSVSSSTITISAGQAMDSILVTSVFDGVEEGDETVIIDMDPPTNAIEDGTQQVTLTITDEDAAPPAGYTVSIDQSPINTSNETAASFTFTGAEVGATYNYTFSSSGGGTNVAGSGTIATANQQISGVDLSGLGDGTITLSATLTDTFGNTGSAATDTETKDTTPPAGYSVVIDQNPVNSANETATSFTFAGAEVGATYNYTFSSSGGGTNVTGSGTIATASEQITGIDLSGLGDGTITLSVTLTDVNGNTGSPATDTETKDTSIPAGYTVVIDQSPINSANETATSFTFTGAEVSATYNYTFSSSGGGTNVTGSGTVATASEQITGIDLSGLGDGTITLSVTLTDTNGNTGSAATDTEIKETVPPTGYSVVIDQSLINNGNESAVSFTFTGAEVGVTYNYTFSSSGGGTNVTGSGTIATATEQITGIDLSGLGDGTITLNVTLTDTNGNTGSAATDTAIKDTTAPAGYSVTFDQFAANAFNQTHISFTFSGAETGTTYNYTISSSGGGTNVTGSGTVASANQQISGIDVSGLGDGFLTLSVTLTDNAGNIGVAVTDDIDKDTVIPLGYTVSMDLLGEPVINVINQNIIEFSAFDLEIGTTLNYAFTSDGGGIPVTGTETVTTTPQQFDNGGAGYDLSGLTDGTITLTISLTDFAGNTGPDATTTETKDAGPPTGYSVAWDDALINASEATTASFTVSGAEIGATINNTVSSSGDGNTATVSNPTTVTSNNQVVTIDVSSLTDGTLTVQVTLTDVGGNTGSVVSDNSAVLDQTAPSGYTVDIDQASINVGNVSALSFTFTGAEVGATYNYTFSSSGGGADVTGSGTIASATDQITGIDLSGLADGTITLSVTLTDPAGNIGSPVTNTAAKDASAPVFISVDDNGGDNSYRSGESLTIVADLGETGLTVTADLSVINSGLSGSATMTDNGDGTYSITIADVDDSGNMIEGTAIAVPLTATDAANNQQPDNSLVLNLDKTAPAGYTVAIDQADINAGNHNAVSFTFAGAEAGTTYNYTFSSSGGGTDVTGSGAVASANEQVTGIDLSGLADGTVTLSVTLTDVAGNTGTPATDNVAKTAATIQFSATSSSGSESAASASLQVELSIISAQNITVDYTVSGTATGGGTDYTLADGTLTINPGGQSGSIDITDIVDDQLVEANETIVVTLSNPANATLGANTVHTYTITDNDAKQPQVITFEPIPNVTLGEGPIQLQATGGGSGQPVTFSIRTQPASGVATLSNGTVIIEGVGTVSITASQAGNDFYEAAADVTRTFEILPNELFLPTLFSPNNDQTNDRFIIRGGGDIAEIELSIFDRDGNLVFNSSSFTELTQSGWDGTNEGTKQPQGAYVWVVRGSFSNGSPILINGKDTGIIRLAR